MCLKKMFAAANCLALLLAFGAPVGDASASALDASAFVSHASVFASAFASRSNGAGRSVVRQRRGARRKARRRRMSKRPENGSVREGPWGGAHVRLVVREGGGDLEFDCARGSVSAPFVTDAEGRFDLPGTYTRQGPGPIRVGRLPSASPARYFGRVEGETMTLGLKIEGAAARPDAYTLKRGSEGRISKCY